MRRKGLGHYGYSIFFKSSRQCKFAAGKASRILGIIKETLLCRDGVMLTKLYKTLIGPCLEYDIQA